MSPKAFGDFPHFYVSFFWTIRSMQIIHSTDYIGYMALKTSVQPLHHESLSVLFLSSSIFASVSLNILSASCLLATFIVLFRIRTFVSGLSLHPYLAFNINIAADIELLDFADNSLSSACISRTNKAFSIISL